MRAVLLQIHQDDTPTAGADVQSDFIVFQGIDLLRKAVLQERAAGLPAVCRYRCRRLFLSLSLRLQHLTLLDTGNGILPVSLLHLRLARTVEIREPD